MRFERISLLLAFVMALGLCALGVWRLSTAGIPQVQILIVAWEILIGILAIGGFVAVVRKRLTPRAFWELLFTASLFLGVWFFPLLAIPFDVGILVALVLMLLPFLFPYVASWNLFYLVGSVGVSFYFAQLLSPTGLLVLAIGLTLHDLFVFGETGFFAHWSPLLLPRRIMPGFALVRSGSDLIRSVTSLQDHPLEYISASELLLPLAMFVRALASGWMNGVWIFVGLLIGFCVSLILRKVESKPTEAAHARTLVPWMIVGAGIPFLLLWILGWLV